MRRQSAPSAGVALAGLALVAIAAIRPVSFLLHGAHVQRVRGAGAGRWEILLAFVPYVAALLIVRASERRIPAWLLYGPGIVAAGLLLIAPPTGSGDIFEYAFYGKMLAHGHLNPLTTAPIRMRGDPWFRFVGWKRQPSVYGPVWVYVAGGAAALAGSRIAVAIGVLKLVSVAGLLAGGFYASRLMDDEPGARRRSLVAFLWNPLVLFAIAGDGHVEGVLLGLVVGALYARRRERNGVASVLLFLASMIKVYCGLFLVLHLVAAMRARTRPSRERQVAHVGLIAAASAGAYLPLWSGRATFSGLIDIGSRFSATLMWLLRDSVGDLLQPIIGSSRAAHISTISVRVFVAATIIAIVIASIRRAGRTPDARLWGLAFAGYLLVAPWFLSWHLLPLIGLAVISWRSPSDSALAWAALTFSATALFSAAPIRYGIPAAVFIAIVSRRKTSDVAGRAMLVRDVVAFALGRSAGALSRALRLGAGETVSGRVAVRISDELPARITSTFSRGVVVVSGTNGKTTTATMIRAIATSNGIACAGNRSGSNLWGGVVGGLVEMDDAAELGVFEVDEAALARVIPAIRPKVLVLTNVFRDQLDRFGEPEIVTALFREAVVNLPDDAVVIANADDPALTSIGGERRAIRFGARVPGDPATTWGAEPELCPSCSSPLEVLSRTFAHLGTFRCGACLWTNDSADVVVDVLERRGLDAVAIAVGDEHLVLRVGGAHNAYNAAAAIAAGDALGIARTDVLDALARFRPAFGRGELIVAGDARVLLTLAKNPAGANAILSELVPAEVGAIVLAINDRAADGRDVSWIWDIDTEPIRTLGVPVLTSGTRASETALMLRCGDVPVVAIERHVAKAVEEAARLCSPGWPVVVVATYTAVLALRRRLLGGNAAAVAEPVYA